MRVCIIYILRSAFLDWDGTSVIPILSGKNIKEVVVTVQGACYDRVIHRSSGLLIGTGNLAEKPAPTATL